MERHSDVQVLASRTIHDGRIFRVLSESIRLPSGLRQDLDVVDHDGAVAMAPVLDDGRLLLVRQYRHAAGDWLEEIPAGRLESSDGDRLEAARRELEEETGRRAERWAELAEFYPAPGFCSERMTLYLAEGLHPIPGGGRPPDPDEELDLVARTPAEIVSGGCLDAKTLLAASLLIARGS